MNSARAARAARTTRTTRAARSAGTALGVLVTAAALVALVSLRPRRVVVEGASMEPTLLEGDRLLVVGGPGPVARPGVGDIVALADPELEGRLLVKRIVSVEGGLVRVEGDNEGPSRDSRSFGPVDRGEVRGRAVYRYFPAGRAGRLGRKTGRLGRKRGGDSR